MTPGERIRRRRRELGLSQREIQGAGVSYAYISRIEAGCRTPSVKALRTIAPRLGVSAHWLEFGEQDPADVMEEAARSLMRGGGLDPNQWEIALGDARARLDEAQAEPGEEAA